jgi:hypothetical protein
MRKPGRASTPAEIARWPFKKVTHQSTMQTRRDKGGNELLKQYRKDAAAAGIPARHVNKVAKLMYKATKDVVDGSQKRTKSKFTDLERRGAGGLEVADSLIEAAERLRELFG